jgi:carnitine O-acetyltransferase
MKMAKEGQGIDRHLMGLKLLAIENGLPVPSLFADPAYDKSRHWRLSTSNCGLESLALFTFGPVVEDGFGVGYVVHENDIAVSVTSKRSCPSTNSRLFVRTLEKSLLDMRDIASPSSKL